LRGRGIVGRRIRTFGRRGEYLRKDFSGAKGVYGTTNKTLVYYAGEKKLQKAGVKRWRQSEGGRQLRPTDE